MKTLLYTLTCNSRISSNYFYIKSIIRPKLLFLEMFHINCNSTFFIFIFLFFYIQKCYTYIMFRRLYEKKYSFFIIDYYDIVCKF